MANPTGIGGDNETRPVLIECSGAAVTVTLDPQRKYTLRHTGLNKNLGAQADLVSLAFSGTTTATAVVVTGAGTGIGLLVSATEQTVGPGLSSLSLITAANSPLVIVIPGERVGQVA